MISLLLALTVTATSAADEIAVLCTPPPNLSIMTRCFDEGTCSELEMTLAKSAICYRRKAQIARRVAKTCEEDRHLDRLEHPLDVASHTPFPVWPTVALTAVALCIGGAIGALVVLEAK